MQQQPMEPEYTQQPMVRRKSAVIVTIAVALAVCILTAGVTLNFAMMFMARNQVVVADSDYQLLDMIKGMFASYGLEGQKFGTHGDGGGNVGLESFFNDRNNFDDSSDMFYEWA